MIAKVMFAKITEIAQIWLMIMSAYAPLDGMELIAKRVSHFDYREAACKRAISLLRLPWCSLEDKENKRPINC